MLQLSEVVIEDPNGVRMMQWLDQKVTQYQGLLGKNLIVPEKVLTKFILLNLRYCFASFGFCYILYKILDLFLDHLRS